MIDNSGLAKLELFNLKYWLDMVALEQCEDILNLTSCSWGKNRIAVVAHSFRVMSKARNYDEMVVGLMHHVYCYSRYARGLYSCDVECGYLWRDTLDLLSGNNKSDSADETCPVMDYCGWSSAYQKKILCIGADRTARNVMIYDLEDTLDLLLHPEKICSEEAVDNGIFMRELTDEEKNGLIDKYSRAIKTLKSMGVLYDSQLDDFTEETYAIISKLCIEWYDEWLASVKENEEMFNDAEGNK